MTPLTYKVLRLSDADRRILARLARAPLHTSVLAREVGVPRTTVAYRLRQLKERGLVERHTVRRKPFWRLSFRPGRRAGWCRTFRGGEIVQVYSELLSLPRNSVVYCIQGRDAPAAEFAVLPHELIQRLHRAYKSRRILFRCISNTEILQVFQRVRLDRTMIASHIGRLVSAKLFTNGLFLGSGELVVTRNFVLLTNPKTRVAVRIRDDGIVDIVYDLLSLLFDVIEPVDSFDLNRYLQTMLSECSESSEGARSVVASSHGRHGTAY